jgi:hypothetical protein
MVPRNFIEEEEPSELAEIRPVCGLDRKCLVIWALKGVSLGV